MVKVFDIMKKYGIYGVMFFIILLGIVLRLKLILHNQSLWSDECSIYMNILSNNYLQFFQPLDYAQVAPPFFLMIEKFMLGAFKNFLPMEMSLRIFPCICSIAALILLPIFTHKIYKNELVTAGVTFIVAFAPRIVNYANEAKQYSFELLISILLMMAFYFWDIKTFSKKKLLIFSVLISIIPFFSLSSYFVIAAGSVYILYDLYKNRKVVNARVYASLYLVPIVVVGLLAYTFYFSAVVDELYEGLFAYWTDIEPCMLTLSNFYRVFSLTVHDDIGIFSFIGKNILAITFFGSLILFWIKNNTKLKFLFLLSLAFTIFAGFLNAYPYNNRLVLFLVPVFAIVICQALLFLNKKSCSLMVGIALLVGTAVLYKDYSLDNYIIHKAKIREVYSNLKEINPKLKNVIGPAGCYKCYADQEVFYELNIWDKFDDNKFKNIICDMPYGTYYIFLPVETPFNRDLRNALKSSDKVIMTPFYSLKNEEKEEGVFDVIKIQNVCSVNNK